MGDFNIAQFIGGIVEGMGKGLMSDKGGSQGVNMEVIPKRKNAPPIIEMTPSQQAGRHIQEGAIGAIRGMATSDDLDRGGGAGVLSPATPMQRDGSGVVMRAPVEEAAFVADVDDMSPMPRWRAPRHPMRQMRSGGITEPGEEVIVHENEKVQGLPNGQVIVTPEEEVAVDRQGAPSETVLRGAGAHTSPDLPPNMSLPDTVQQGPNDEGYLQNELLKNMDVKPSPWKDLGAALIQAGNNYFNNKNEPVRTWGEIQRDKKVAPLAAKLALVRDAKKTRMDADTNAARLGLITEQAKTIGRDDALNIEKETRLKTKDENNVKMWERKLDQADVKLAQASLKLAQDAELIKLRDKWALADDEIGRRRLALVEQEMANRMTRHDETMTERRLSREDLNKYRGASLTLRQAEKEPGLTPAKQKDIAARKQKLRESLITKVRAGQITQADMDDILSEEVDAGFGSATGEVDK